MAERVPMLRTEPVSLKKLDQPEGGSQELDFLRVAEGGMKCVMLPSSQRGVATPVPFRDFHADSARSQLRRD